MTENKNVYTYGSNGDNSVKDRIAQWIIAGKQLDEYITWILSDNKYYLSFRSFIFNDEELLRSFHLWLEEYLEWPIDQEDPENFWQLKFARRFNATVQAEYLLKFYKAKVQSLMTDDED